jgi:hypothetical protein
VAFTYNPNALNRWCYQPLCSQPGDSDDDGLGSIGHRLYWMPLGHSDSQLALASECISRSRTEIAAYVHRVLQKSVTQIGCAHNCVPIATLPRPFRPCLSARHVLNHRARRRSRDRLCFVK